MRRTCNCYWCHILLYASYRLHCKAKSKRLWPWLLRTHFWLERACRPSAGYGNRQGVCQSALQAACYSLSAAANSAIMSAIAQAGRSTPRSTSLLSSTSKQ
eukprot:6176484-Pleurochrysis_carterae.AAC.1